MTELSQVIVLTTLAGATMPVGALLANVERIYPRWLEQNLHHAVIAFGGGALLAAVALVLVPHGIETVSIGWAVTAFLVGGLAFFLLDLCLSATESSGGQLAAMLTDFLPEALALGAAVAAGGSAGLVLALLIALQNLPEGFNAHREITATGRAKGAHLIIGFLLLVPLGPIAGVIGYFWLSDFPEAVGFISLFAASGILYLTFQDIAPQSHIRKRQAPAMGAVLGFLLGLAGHMLIVGP